MPRFLVLLFVSWLCLATTQARAQTGTPAWTGRTSPSLQERIGSEERGKRATLIEADSVSGTPEIQVILEGNATLRRADTLVRAQKIDYSIEHDHLKATGQVRVNRGGNIGKSVFTGGPVRPRHPVCAGSVGQPFQP